jgi:hypothetical protein
MPTSAIAFRREPRIGFKAYDPRYRRGPHVPEAGIPQQPLEQRRVTKAVPLIDDFTQPALRDAA